MPRDPDGESVDPSIAEAGSRRRQGGGRSGGRDLRGNATGQLAGGDSREPADDPSPLAVFDAPGNERSTTVALLSESDPVRQVADNWVAKWSGDAVVATQTVAIVLAIATNSVDIARRSLAAVAEYLQWRG